MTEEERAAAKANNKKAQQKLRQQMTEEQQAVTKAKDKKAHEKHRQEMTEEQQAITKAKDKKAHEKHHQEMTEEQQGATKAANKKAQQKHRQQMTEEQLEQENKNAQARMRQVRKSRQVGVGKNEALLTSEILAGTHPVLDLKDTPDTIGKMEVVCNFCGALKFKKETGSTCCSHQSRSVSYGTTTHQRVDSSGNMQEVSITLFA